MDTKILRSLSYGVYIVTALDGETPVGCTANSIMQITSKPATVAVSLNRDNYTNVIVQRDGRLAVSILAEDSDPKLIGSFGFKSSRNVNKFEDIEPAYCDEMPVIADSCGYFVAEVLDAIETTTHTVFIAEIVDGATNPGRRPMTYAYYHEVVKGKTAKNAPTYVEDEAAPQPEPAAQAEAPAPAPEPAADEGGFKWVCLLCGYVYDGDTPFEELPDDWTCPLCGAAKSLFEKRPA